MTTLKDNKIFVALFLFLFVFFVNWLSAADGDSASMTESRQYFVQLLGTRTGWPENMTAEEEQIMQEHFVYLKNLVNEQKVILAGPVFENVFGLVILNVSSQAEAEKLMTNEPTVVKGVHTYVMHPMNVSLTAEPLSYDRYVRLPSERKLSKEIVVKAPVEQVWQTWTTTEGVVTFFSSQAKVELKPGGSYEIYFITEAPYGQRGSEGCRILSYLPMEVLCFEWNAPPSFGELREVHTQVTVIFKPLSEKETLVKLVQYGWGKSAQWDELYDYFDKAWTHVLGNLKKRFTEGPLDWKE